MFSASLPALKTPPTSTTASAKSPSPGRWEGDGRGDRGEVPGGGKPRGQDRHGAPPCQRPLPWPTVSPMTTSTPTEFRRLGSSGPTVFPLSLGCMGMSGMYGPSDEAESIATIHAALDHGVNLLDTGDFYGMGHNEMLIGRALRDRRDRALLSVKFGGLRGPDAGWIGFDARPAAVKNFLAYSLTRLGVDHIDVYRPARLDPAVPIEETIGAIAEMVKAGYVRAIGLSEVGPETIRRAHEVHPISDLQIEYSLISRAPELTILPVLEQLGIGVTAYGVLSRGLLSGSATSAPGDFRARLP